MPPDTVEQARCWRGGDRGNDHGEQAEYSSTASKVQGSSCAARWRVTRLRFTSAWHACDEILSSQWDFLWGGRRCGPRAKALGYCQGSESRSRLRRGYGVPGAASEAAAFAKATACQGEPRKEWG